MPICALGYRGSYDRVAAFARNWKQRQHEAQQTTGRGTFVPLTFAPGEAFQFDWSEDWAVMGGERTKLKDCSVQARAQPCVRIAGLSAANPRDAV
jgi:hypothetical protein